MWVSLRSLSQRCQLKLKTWECPWFQGKPTVAHCRPLVDGISTIQYNWASISFSEKLYGAEVINSFLWNGATDKPHAARIAWSDINPPQKECWLGLCKNMAAIMWSIWRLFATLGSIWEVTTLDGSWGWRKSSIYWDKKWEMEIKSFTNIITGKLNENLCMTLTLTLPVPVHRQLNCFLSYQLDNSMATSQVRKVGMHVFKINCLTSKLHAWISWSELTLSKISLFYFIYFPSLNS